jgi:hypothetical protein
MVKVKAERHHQLWEVVRDGLYTQQTQYGADAADGPVGRHQRRRNNAMKLGELSCGAEKHFRKVW